MKTIHSLVLAGLFAASNLLQAGPALINAAIKGEVEIVKERAAAGENVNDVDEYGWTALMWALYYERGEVVEFLLASSADINLCSTQKYKSFPAGTSALAIAVQRGREDDAKTLLARGAKKDAVDAKGNTIVSLATQSGNFGILKLLGVSRTGSKELDDLFKELEAGKKVNDADLDGWTPLIWAAYMQNPSALEELLGKGADPNLASTRAARSIPAGATALTIAGYFGLEKAIEPLLGHQAQRDHLDKSGNCAESYARKYRHYEVLKRLGTMASSDSHLNALLEKLKADGNPNTLDSFGWTPLMWAVNTQETAVVEFLLDRGADPNVRSMAPNKKLASGLTALIIAGHSGLDDIAKLLVARGANRDIADDAGKTAMAHARESRYHNALNALASTAPLPGKYNIVLVEEATTNPEILSEFRYIASELHATTLDAIRTSDQFAQVENLSGNLNPNPGTLILQIETETIKKPFALSDAPPEEMTARVKFVDAATGKIEREETFANPYSFSIGSANFGWSWGQDKGPLGPSKSCAKDLAQVIAGYTLRVCGRTAPKEDAKPVTHPKSDFSFPDLSKGKVALWPLVYLDLDLDVAETAYKAHETREKVLEAVYSRLLTVFTTLPSGKILDSKTLFQGSESHTFLDPHQFLPWPGKSNSNSREPSLATLAKHPGLQGVRYLVFPRLLRMSRTVRSDFNPIMGGSKSATTRSALHLAIVELATGNIVWDDVITASASSTMMKATALKENLDDLVEDIQKRVAGTIR